MALCLACEAISISALICELDQVPHWWELLNSKSKPKGMIHHRDARQLPSAADGCPLCAMMMDAVLQNEAVLVSGSRDQAITAHGAWDIRQFSSHLINSAIYLRPNIDPLKRAFPEQHVTDAAHIRGFKVFIPVDCGIVTVQIRLFAPKESPAGVSCEVIGRPILPSSASPDAFNLVHRWLKTCIDKHDACRETFSGAVVDESSPPILPTRVIQLGRPNEGIAPRLAEANGRTGEYVALSHCWGRHRPPLMTTQSTFRRHLTGIPWTDIPKAYQDAMTATHRLGFMYIWIDSLCIVQDSQEDWLYESQRMGTVYENARLTIAASHAADSSQPCFFPRPQPPATVELPFFSSSGERAGSMFAQPMPTDYVPISPEYGPLASRAWATQEWLLSRRMIFYTAGCLVWSCKVISQRETGGSFHSTARNPRWKVIIEKYSARSLTQARDRLIALEGLRIEMGKKRANDIYCFGLWLHSMPDQLLWFCLEPAERAKSPLDLPTWTWASTIHGVRFLDFKKAKNACEGFQFDEANKTLIIRSALKRATVIFPTDEESSQSHTNASPSSLKDALQDGMPENMMCAIRGSEESVHGWGVLDERGPPTIVDVFCLRLMSLKLTTPTTDGRKTKHHQDWSLLLQKRPGFSEVYQRIGASVISCDRPWFEDETVTHVYLR